MPSTSTIIVLKYRNIPLISFSFYCLDAENSKCVYGKKREYIQSQP